MEGACVGQGWEERPDRDIWEPKVATCKSVWGPNKVICWFSEIGVTWACKRVGWIEREKSL